MTTSNIPPCRCFSRDSVRRWTVAAVLSTGMAYGAGELDMTFRPVVAGQQDVVRAVSVLPDGRIVIGGGFGGVNGVGIAGMAMLNTGGQLNTAYNPAPGGVVFATSPLRDGRLMVGGHFAVIGGQHKTGLARLSEVGTVDASFTSGISHLNSAVRAFAVVPWSGALVVGGPFGLERLQQNGPREDGFAFYVDAGQNLGVTNISLRQTGPILMSGTFAVDTEHVNENFIESVLEDGTENTAFTANVSGGAVFAHAVQADGSILIGGEFGSVGGASRPYLARLSGGGARDTNFSPVVNNAVRAIALQADGKILIGGDFTTVNGESRRGVARLLPNGELDETFNANLYPSAYTVNGISLQGDGKILINGNFVGTLEGTTVVQQMHFARLLNDGVTQELRATSSTRVQWLRGGALPEVEAVEFEISTSGSWQLLGHGVRIQGGWEWTGGVLPAAAQIRARARAKSGMNGGSQSLYLSPVAIYPVPVTAVTDEQGAVIEDGGVREIGPAFIGLGKDVTFLVKNVGTGNLTEFATQISGDHAAAFTVVTEPEAPVEGPLGSTPLVVRFTPDGPGVRAAILTVSSTDPANPQYQIVLRGEGGNSQELWREHYFGTPENEGEGADGEDPDGDGLDNRFEFVAGLDPTDPASKFVVTAEPSAGNVVVRFGPCFENRTYAVERSATLEAGSWVPATGVTVDDGDGKVFTDGDPVSGKRFYRVIVTKP